MENCLGKNKKPAYYKIGNRYVALNRHARKMFKKEGIDYIIPNQMIVPSNFKKTKDKKGNKNEKNDKIKR